MNIYNLSKKIIKLHCNFQSCYVKLKVYIHNIYSTINRKGEIQLCSLSYSKCSPSG